MCRESRQTKPICSRRNNRPKNVDQGNLSRVRRAPRYGETRAAVREIRRIRRKYLYNLAAHPTALEECLAFLELNLDENRLADSVYNSTAGLRQNLATVRGLVAALKRDAAAIGDRNSALEAETKRLLLKKIVWRKRKIGSLLLESRLPFLTVIEALKRARSRWRRANRSILSVLPTRFKRNDVLRELLRRPHEVLIRKSFKYARNLARQYRGFGVDFEDLLQEGTLSVLQRLDTFEYWSLDSINSKLSSCIERALRMMSVDAEIENRFFTHIDINRRRPEGVLREHPGRWLFEPESEERRRYRCEGVKAAVERLDARDQRVIKLRNGLEGTALDLSETGAILHVTREKVRQLEFRACNVLQQDPNLRSLTC